MRRRWVVLGFCAVAAQWARADWPVYQHDPGHTGYVSSSLDPAKLKFGWSSPTGYIEPVLAEGSIYSASRAAISAFDPDNGSVRWNFSSPGVTFEPVSYADGMIFALGFTQLNTAAIYVLDASTGAMKYSVPLPNGTQIASAGTMIHRLGTGDLFGLFHTDHGLMGVTFGANSGAKVWNGTANGNPASPAVVGSSAVIAGPGQFYAYNLANGAENHFFAGGINGGGGSAPVVDGAKNHIYIAQTVDPQVGAITAFTYTSPTSITQLWQRTDLGFRFRDPALGPDGKVYYATDDTLYELDPESGQTLRSLPGQSFARGSSFIISNGFLYGFSPTQQVVYDLNNLTLVKSFPNNRGNSNTELRSPGLLDDNHYAFDFAIGSGADRFDVYVVPEPGGFLMVAAVLIWRGQRRSLARGLSF